MTEIWIFTVLIMLIMNVYQVFLYFKLAGRPYKSDKLYENVKYVGVIVFLWNVGFIVKFSVIS